MPAILARSLCVLLVFLFESSGLFGQVASYSTLKKGLMDAFAGGDPKSQAAALGEFTTCGEPEGARVLLRMVRTTNERLLAVRLEFIKAGEAEIAHRAEVSKITGLVKRGKLGKGAQEKAEEIQRGLVIEVGRLNRDIVELERNGRVLRESVGRLIAGCEGDQKVTALRIVVGWYDAERSLEGKAEILQVLGWIEHSQAYSIIEQALEKGPDPLRVAALAAIEERGGAGAIELALSQLTAEVWQVRAAALRVLRKTGGLRAAQELVRVIEREEGRLITDAVTGLREITGQNFYENAALWREWLGKEGSKLPPPRERGQGAKSPESKKATAGSGQHGRGGHARPGTQFYGIETRSKNLVYVLDYSGSMQVDLEDPRNEQGRDTSPPKPNGGRKIDRLVRELVRSVVSLPPDATFNIVLFAGDVDVWKPKMQTATPEVKEEAKAWILARPAGGSTNLFGGMEKAFGLAGRGSFDKQYKTSADTIFLLSDGNPSSGRIVSLPEILREIKALNGLRRLAIHTVGLGKGANARFLGLLAKEHDGEFVHVLK